MLICIQCKKRAKRRGDLFLLGWSSNYNLYHCPRCNLHYIEEYGSTLEATDNVTGWSDYYTISESDAEKMVKSIAGEHRSTFDSLSSKVHIKRERYALD